MANFRLSKLVLQDKFPGAVNPNLSTPTDGWDNTKDNFVTTAASDQPSYPVGTKISVYTDNTNCPGYYTMAYLALTSCYSSGACISADFSDGKFFCSHPKTGCASQTQFADTSEVPYYVVHMCYTTAATDLTKGTPVAIPCATLAPDGSAASTNGYGDAYGWFWVGGVCPCKDATILDDGSGNYKGVDVTVDGALHPGPVFVCYTAATQLITSADETNALDNTTGIVTVPDPAACIIGWACSSGA